MFYVIAKVGGRGRKEREEEKENEGRGEKRGGREMEGGRTEAARREEKEEDGEDRDKMIETQRNIYIQRERRVKE